MAAEVERIADFLGKKLTKEQTEVICRECSFNQMKDNASVNRLEMQDKYGVMDFTVSPYMKGGMLYGIVPRCLVTLAPPP